MSACFAGIWIESHEHQDALTEITQICRDEQWQIATWDIEAGDGAGAFRMISVHPKYGLFSLAIGTFVVGRYFGSFGS